MGKSKKYDQIMVDLETLGTRADSVILAIGAVKFSLATGEMDDQGFYASISIDSNHDAGMRHISEDTLMWWMKQSDAAREVFQEPKTTLASALEDFSDWFDHGDYNVWGNGADFDVAMLTHAFSTHEMATPWQFFNVRCFRTLKNLPMFSKVPKPANTLAHNALHDAVAQTQHLLAMYGLQKVAA